MKIGGMQQRCDDESFLSKLQDHIGLWRATHVLATPPQIGREQAAFSLHSQIELFIPRSFRSNLWRL